MVVCRFWEGQDGSAQQEVHAKRHQLQSIKDRLEEKFGLSPEEHAQICATEALARLVREHKRSLSREELLRLMLEIDTNHPDTHFYPAGSLPQPEETDDPNPAPLLAPQRRGNMSMAYVREGF